MIGQFLSVLAIDLLELCEHRLLADTNTHGRDLQCALKRLEPENDVTVQVPVIIVRSTAVVRFAIKQRPAYLLDKDSTLLLCDQVLSLLAGLVRPSLLKFSRCHKAYFIRQPVDCIRPFIPDFVLHVFNNLKDSFDYSMEHLRRPVRFSYDHLPVPLIHIA